MFKRNRPAPHTEDVNVKPDEGRDASSPRPSMSREALIAAGIIWDRQDKAQERVFHFRIMMVLAAVAVLSLALNIVQMMTPATERYFATEPNGALIPLVPLSSPIMSDSALSDWTVRAVTQAFTLTWSNYRSDESQALPNFTSDGQQSYLDGLQSAKIIQLLTSEGENLTSVATGAPVILQKGDDRSSKMFWELQFPMVWTYAAGGNTTQGASSNAVTVKVVVIRAPQTQSPSGLEISQILVSRNQ